MILKDRFLVLVFTHSPSLLAVTVIGNTKLQSVYVGLGLWESELRGDALLCSLATNHFLFVL